jgi:hypothetical protein
MGGFDGENIRKALTIPEGFDPVVVFAIGYADQPMVLPEDLQKRELAPRSRKPLKDFVYTEQWGAPSVHVQTQNSLLTQTLTN